MEKEFVPYTESLELKKLGFDEPCFGYWFNETPTNPQGQCIVYYKKPWDNEKIVKGVIREYCSAPTIAEVVMWLYEKHGIWIYLVPAEDNKEVFKPFFRGKNIIDQHLTEFFESPTETYEAAIEYTLNNLI